MSKWLLVILVLAAFLRLIFLNEIPPGPSYDEIQVIGNAESLAKTGQSIPGTVTGIIGQAQGLYETGVFSELGSYLLIPWVVIFGVDWPLIKFPFVLVSLGMILMVYLITKRLINEKCALIASLLFAINPWSIQMGRTAYESLFSYLFYLLALYGFIAWKGWKILLTLPFLALGFLTYFGAKPQLPFIAAMGILTNYLYYPGDFKRNIKPLTVTIVIALFSFSIYSLLFIHNPSSLRLNETKKQTISSSIDFKRRVSIPSFLGNISENKLTEQFNERALGFLGSLSPNFLFIEGSTWGPEFLSISDHGPMYFIDFFLIIAGVIALSKLYPKALLVTGGMIVIALLPNAVSLSAKNYTVRIGLLYPLLTILSSYGIWYVVYLFKSKKVKKLSILFITLLYSLSFIIFVNRYYFRTSIEKNEGWNLQHRILAHYLKLDSETNLNQKHAVVAYDLNGISYIYLLFSGNYQSFNQIKNINSILAQGSYNFGNVNFINKCPQNLDTNETLIVDAKVVCRVDQKYNSQIASPKDGGGKYHIYNDKLCNQDLKTFPLVESINDLNIEKMSKKVFCNKWITRP